MIFPRGLGPPASRDGSSAAARSQIYKNESLGRVRVKRERLAEAHAAQVVGRSARRRFGMWGSGSPLPEQQSKAASGNSRRLGGDEVAIPRRFPVQSNDCSARRPDPQVDFALSHRKFVNIRVAMRSQGFSSCGLLCG